MAAANFTSIDELVKRSKSPYTPPPTKEMEPSISKEEQRDIRIIVEHKDLDQEIQPHVQVRQEVIEVPPDLQKMGVQATPTTHFQTQQKVQSLIPDEEIVEGLKQPTTSSFRWLAELALYILKHAHITLKNVHGKIVRIIRN